MTPAGILLRAALGGAFIALILWIAQAHRPFVAGLLLFFPIISVPTFYFMARDHGMPQVRETILGGLMAVPVWACFAGALYWASYRFKIAAALGVALGAWFLIAACMVALRMIWAKT